MLGASDLHIVVPLSCVLRGLTSLRRLSTIKSRHTADGRVEGRGPCLRQLLDKKEPPRRLLPDFNLVALNYASSKRARSDEPPSLLLPSPLLPVLLCMCSVVDERGLGGRGSGGRGGRRLLVQCQLVHHGGEGLAVMAEAIVLSSSSSSSSAAAAAAGLNPAASGVSLKEVHQ